MMGIKVAALQLDSRQDRQANPAALEQGSAAAADGAS